MRVINILLLTFILTLKSFHCNEDIWCGNLPGGLETLSNGRGNTIPWGAFITTTAKDGKSGELYPGILISPSLIFMSTHYFYNDKLRQLQILRKHGSYTAVVGSSEFSSSTLQGQHIPVSFVSIHPNFSRVSYWTDTTSNFALAHLSRPVEPSASVQPVCIPSFSNQQTLEEIKETKFLFLFGWPSKQATTCSGIRLQVSSHEKCLQVFAEVVKQSYREDLYCAAVSETNGNGVCPNRDFGSFYQLNGSYYLGGPVINLSGNNGNCTKGINFLIWSVTNETLEWIRNSERCGSDYFTCFVDGKCIPISKLCDGKLDCEDSSDEHAQYCRNPVACTKDEFQCQLYGSCVPKFKMDDGFSDCLGGDDETNSINHYLIAGLGVSVIFVSLLTTGLVCGYLERRRLKTQIRNLTEEEIDEFRKGLHQPLTADITKSSRTEEEYCQLYINRRILANPWKEEHEIPMKCIQIGNELNRGNFGVVYKGHLISENVSMSPLKTSVVAVKTYVSSVTVEEFKNMLREVKILSHVGAHEYIVSFLGACTGNIKKRKLYLILELCEFGDLLNYLKSHIQTSFETYLEPGGDLSEDIEPRATAFNSHKNLTTDDLLKWAFQIANGMAYLEVIHGDLASRNILLNNTLDAKISDFGLARELNDSDIYVKSPRELLPWRWLALESFTGRIYSHKTDVWAYGVTLWEIFSLGQIPYGETHFNWDFVVRIQSGIRLPSPPFASAELYAVLLNTWSEIPDSRPTFVDLHTTISTIRTNRYVNIV